MKLMFLFERPSEDLWKWGNP